MDSTANRQIMADTIFEDKRPILECSICDFEVKSVPSMENHLSAVHGLKLKLEIIDSNNTETPVPEAAQTTEINEMGETLSQTNDLGFNINKAQNTENQIAKSNHPVSKNAHTKMEAKNEKSTGLLRSFRMNKQDDNIQISPKKLEKESDIKRNDIKRKEKTLEEIMFPNFDKEENANFDIPMPEMNTVHLHRTQSTVSNENVTNANQNRKDKFTEHPGLDHELIRQQKLNTILENTVNKVTNTLNLNLCAPNDKDLNTPYQCDSCNKTIKGSVMLQAHQYQEHHENPNIGLLGDVGNKHVCRVCLKLFTRSSDVKAHILGVHCNDRRYPCTMCEKRFKESFHLWKHLKTHTGKFIDNYLVLLRQRTIFQITYTLLQMFTKFYLFLL